MSSLAGEDRRRAVMAFRICFEGGFQFDIFPVRQILGHLRSALFFREFERDADTGFHHPGGQV